jgi:hypothetical protein
MRNHLAFPVSGTNPTGFVAAGPLILLVILLAFVSEVRAAPFTAFGPENYAGKGETTKTFSILNPAAAYTLHIDNGGASGQYAKVSSGVITLNGTQVVKPSDFNQTVTVIEKPLTLLENNTLAVDLRSNPDSGITLHVIGEDGDPPTITYTVEPPANAAGWHHSDVTVSFACSDTTSGIATCPSPVTVSTEGGNQQV